MLAAIRAMAAMGPWTLTQIEVHRSRDEQCKVCGTWIKWVWIMEQQTEPRIWRIGSECGPNLEGLSELLWQRTTRPFKTSVRHVQTLEKLARWESEYPSCCPTPYPVGWAKRYQEVIAAGGLDDHMRLVIGHHVSQADTQWRAAMNRYRAVGSATARKNH